MQLSQRKQMKSGLIKIIITFFIGVVLYKIGGVELMAFYMLFIISLLLAGVSNLEKGASKIVTILDKNKMIINSDFWKKD